METLVSVRDMLGFDKEGYSSGTMGDEKMWYNSKCGNHEIYL